MLEINAPGEDNCLFGIHSVGEGFVARDVRIAGEECLTFQRVTCNSFHPFAFVNVVHQVESPRHGEDGTKAAQHRDERAGLDGSRVNQIRFDFANNASKIENQLRQSVPLEGFASALPNNLIHIFRHKPRLNLPRVPLQLNEENLMPAIRNGFEEAMIVRGITEGKIKDSHEEFLPRSVTKGHKGFFKVFLSVPS